MCDKLCDVTALCEFSLYSHQVSRLWTASRGARCLYFDNIDHNHYLAVENLFVDLNDAPTFWKSPACLATEVTKRFNEMIDQYCSFFRFIDNRYMPGV